MGQQERRIGVSTKTSVCPTAVECPACGRMIATVRHRYSRHSEYPTGPQCPESGRTVSQEAIRNTRLVERAQKVLLWAHVMRDEDPRRVWRWIQLCDRDELELLLAVALAGIPAGMTMSQAYGWVVP